MDSRTQARQELERALRRVHQEQAHGRVHAPAAPFPRAELLLQCEDFLPGDGEAMGAHLTRHRLRVALEPQRERERRRLKEPLTHERQTRPCGEWVGLCLRGEGNSALSATLSRALGPSDGASTARARRNAASWYAELRDAASMGDHPDIDPKLDAHSFLAGTDELIAELVQRFGVEQAEAWPRVLRDPGLDAAHPPARRHRRVAASFEGSALFAPLARCVQVSTGVSARPSVSLLSPGERVHVRVPEYLDGVSADYSVAHATGRALGYALIDGQLPAALRWPVVGSVARSMGALMAQTLHTVDLRLSKRELEAKKLRLAALWVLDVRVAAASALAPGPPELRVEMASRALGAPATPLSTWLLRAPSARSRLRGLRGGLALYFALREHFDEDWHRNPRGAEFLIESCRVGGGTSVEQMIEELGGGEGDALSRLGEML